MTPPATIDQQRKPVPPLRRAAVARAPRPGNHQSLLRLALQLHQAGHLEQAETVYGQLLRLDPACGDALHLLGVLLHQRGDDERAIGCLHRAAALGTPTADFFRHLGEVYRALQRLDDAIDSFERALALEPDDEASLCNLGHAHVQSGRLREAERCYRRALELEPDDPEALVALGAALMSQDRREEAQVAYEKAAAIDPAHPEARHLLAASRRETVATAPRDYVVGVFDRYADTFDAHVVERLGYRVPQHLRAALDTVAPIAAPWRVIDLGCGTGLCGAAVRDRSAHLVGVDLAPRMIDQARRRGIYDVLINDDLGAAFAPELAPADVITAGDVFIYVGDLERVFAGAARSLAPHGLLAFSVEEDDAAGEHYILTPPGRFAHSPAYIHAKARAHGLRIVHEQSIDVRIERQHPAPGRIYVARRDADCAA